ncbi:MAG: hypothetical protein GXP54_01825 [Deltaproteobacteria bacterium]|nr:hypothetical protein [Deltaproteobacteria bacterium]
MFIKKFILPPMLALALSCSSEAEKTGDAGPKDSMEASIDASDIQAGPEADAGCQADAWECSKNGYVLRTCVNGAWVEEKCMLDQGRLCEQGACVDPWRYGSPQWGTCPDDPLATKESLAEKAAYYDAISVRMHIHPKAGWIMSGRIKKVETTCPEGQDPPCYKPAVPESEATWKDIEAYWSGENDGLWSGLYLASQAFRYAVTKDADVLKTIKQLLDGEVVRMKITGVPGVFTRQYVPPDVPGLSCPTDLKSYVPDVEKDDNKWVRIGDGGCIQVVDGDTMQWVTTDHCGLDEFAGWCWLDNVSQDEYAGHMFALGALFKLVDDPEVQTIAKDLIEQVGVHLMEHDLAFVDWDGRVTEHGKLWVTSIADSPGFLAAESLGFIKMAIEATGREDLRDFYDNCLLKKAGEDPCLHWPLESAVKPYTDFLNLMLLYNGPNGGCKSNFNNYSMVMTYIYNLLWFEHDPAVRGIMQDVFDTEVMRFNSPRALIVQKNAWFNFMWAALKRLGPGSDGPDFQAVEDAVCSLREFPASKHLQAHNTYDKYQHFCEGRLGGSQTEFPIPVAERCVHKFLWWGGPYSREKCNEVDYDVHFPGDYLLTYWMGRYFGFISKDL